MKLHFYSISTTPNYDLINPLFSQKTIYKSTMNAALVTKKHRMGQIAVLSVKILVYGAHVFHQMFAAVTNFTMDLLAAYG